MYEYEIRFLPFIKEKVVNHYFTVNEDDSQIKELIKEGKIKFAFEDIYYHDKKGSIIKIY